MSAWPGPLEPFLKDPTVSDVLVNTYRQVYVERATAGADAAFQDERHLMRIIRRSSAQWADGSTGPSPGRRASLADGSRVNVMVSALRGRRSLLSIRKFSKTPLTVAKLLELERSTGGSRWFSEIIVRARLNVVISGGTGSGKTTLLNAMSSFISNRERIITIEDTAELQLQQTHVGRMESRPPNLENAGEVSQRDLLRNALRMRPDRIIVGEVRGAEVLDMLQAMNTGHDGSMTTVHANAPRDALTRLEHMVGMTGLKSRCARFAARWLPP
jgi:pilus assembly protein CpaF